ncbi:tigger transposable element-derived protein 6-like protein [Plakobranchus ocellatus]|uniref:Tigger transposable element-derived protein 6-like protein n=1 Tax=Plakobranchus ocellatus TaxID=259542 RepID=A0AAV4DTA9_9GAST|nr:tigger transposable element-derived protein 6-like protein [Plakobranchus ocellatus]
MAPSKKTAPVKAKVVRKRHDNDTVTKAVDAIKGGLSFCKASATFGIPLGTLVDKVKGRRPKHLKPPHSWRRAEACGMAYCSCREGVWLHSGRPPNDGKETYGPPKRKGGITIICYERGYHAQLWLGTSLHETSSSVSLGKERAIIFSVAVRGWFEELRSCCNAIDPELLKSPQRLFSDDKTGFSFDPNSRKVMAQKGAKHVYKVTANTKKQVTVLVH